jgi:hypothetical protein
MPLYPGGSFEVKFERGNAEVDDQARIDALVGRRLDNAVMAALAVERLRVKRIIEKHITPLNDVTDRRLKIILEQLSAGQ